MCGRFALRNPLALKKTIKVNEIEPRFNIAPNQKINLIADSLLQAKWGFTPYWAKEPFNLINARSETIWKKKSFKDASKCLVPADGWYEWKKQIQVKFLIFMSIGMNYFTLQLYMAAIEENWELQYSLWRPALALKKFITECL